MPVGNNARSKAPMWHDSYVLVLLAVAAIAVLYCVVMVSQGRGGELTEFAPDVPPLDLPDPGQLTAVDFMALQLPVSLVGYHTQSVDETLQRAATALGERDTHIAVLEQRLAELLAGRLQARQESHARPSWAPRGAVSGTPGPVTAHEPPMGLSGSAEDAFAPADDAGKASAAGSDPFSSGEDDGFSSPSEGGASPDVLGGAHREPFEEPEIPRAKHAATNGGGLTTGDRSRLEDRSTAGDRSGTGDAR
jgi:hypothetical protein